AVIYALGKLPFVLAPTSTAMAVLNFALSGVGAAMLYVTVFVYLSNISDLIEWRSGKRMDAGIGTVSGFVTVISSAIATEILAIVLDASGFDASLAQQPQSALTAISTLLGWAPFIVSILMMVATYLLNIDSDLEEMKSTAGESTESVT
ncbi:MAG: MFS transporter, partial [Oscillospiraceae bacterium]|nr:MFS transporter [Oscillospiraceae bacterium]